MSWPIVSAPLAGDRLLREEVGPGSALLWPSWESPDPYSLPRCTPAPGSLGESCPQNKNSSHFSEVNSPLEESWWRDPTPPLVR